MFKVLKLWDLIIVPYVFRYHLYFQNYASSHTLYCQEPISNDLSAFLSFDIRSNLWVDTIFCICKGFNPNSVFREFTNK